MGRLQAPQYRPTPKQTDQSGSRNIINPHLTPPSDEFKGTTLLRGGGFQSLAGTYAAEEQCRVVRRQPVHPLIVDEKSDAKEEPELIENIEGLKADDNNETDDDNLWKLLASNPH